MNIRENREILEDKILKPYACHSKDAKRKYAEEDCKIRTSYQRDRDRIIHSKSFRRLKHKTQVFISPGRDHFRTRLTHTLEVQQIARTIARALELNEDLVEAIALGHDLGHTPFGHSGETVLNRLKPGGFRHNEQSIRVVDFLETGENRRGLNLTEDVLDGILHHTGDRMASTLEGKIIKFADRIAYINHDIDDAIRAGILKEEDLPKEEIEILGSTHSARIGTMISSIINKSYGEEIIEMEPEVYEATMNLRKFMFDRVYLDKNVKVEDTKVDRILTYLYNFYKKDLYRIPKEHLSLYENIEHTEDEIVADYIAGMTDTFAIHVFREICIPKGWDSRDEN